MRYGFGVAFGIAVVVLSGVALHDMAIAHGQHGSIVTGVVIGVDVSPDGELSGFTLVTAEGHSITVAVGIDTEFGLENAVGDRWVSEGGASVLSEAVSRLRDQQRRQQQVTVELSDDDYAMTVVQARPVSVSSNLGYLFAAFAIAWLALMAYVLYLGQRHRSLTREISELTRSDGDES